MRLQQLDLLAFGPFTDVSLRFGESNGAVNIVYGPNEAGKSSALRALRQFLYGIPAQSSDAFVHPYGDLRIGATLCDENGNVQTMTRRKGRVNTLRGADDKEIVSTEFLDRVLQGIDESAFRMRFGIDYDSLTQGGHALVEGQGDLGKSLFSAASGIVRLSNVRKNLETIVGQLFKARGSKPRINAELKEYQQAVQKLHSLELQSDELQDRQDQLRQSEQRQIEWAAEIERLNKRRRELEQQLLALPHLERQERLQTQLAMRDKATAVDAEFHRRRRAAQEQLVRAEHLARQAEDELKSIRHHRQAVQVTDTLLEHRREVETLHQRLAEFDLARKEIDELRQAREASSQILKQRFPAFDSAALRQTDSSTCAELQQLAEEKTHLDVTANHHRLALEKATGELSRLSDEPAGDEPRLDLDPLRDILERGRKDHVRIASRTELAQQLRDNEIRLNQAFDSLQLWSGHPDELMALPLPEGDTIAHFERELRTNAEKIAALQKQQSELKSASEEKKRQREQLRDQYQLPTEQDLRKARSHRDALRETIVARWLGQSLESEPLRTDTSPGDSSENKISDAELLSRYVEATQNADEKVDHLRRESDRVTQDQHLTADCEKLENSLLQVSQQFSAAAEQKRQLDRDWESLWEGSGVRPFSPAEMKSWIERVEELKSLIRLMHDQHKRLAEVETLITSLREELLKALRNVTEEIDESRPLEDLLVAAAKTLTTLENSAGREQLTRHQREALTEEIAKLEVEAQRLSSENAKWQETWTGKLSELGLTVDEQASPQELVKQWVAASSLITDLDRTHARLAKHEKTLGDFQADVEALTSRLGLQNQDQTDSRATIGDLFQRVSDAVAQAARREHLTERQAECESLLEEATKARQESESILADLCKLAGCETAADLDRVEQESRAASQLLEDLAQVSTELKRLAEETPLDKFTAACGSATADGLRREQADIDEKLSLLSTQRHELSESVGRLNSEVEALGDSHLVADVRTDIECLRATLSNDIHKYVRYQMAVAVLEGAIQRFRDRNQGRLLERASQIFQDLTLGGFSGLRSDYSEDGKAVLVGVRHGGKIVQVEHMSEGTCDQLFLALRVAAMEDFLDHHEAVPFVLDDVLIKFDDARVAAALQVFSNLAERTQVIFFTHHEHLLELASQQEGVEVDVHRLDGQPSSIKRTKTTRGRRKPAASDRQRQLFPT